MQLPSTILVPLLLASSAPAIAIAAAAHGHHNHPHPDRSVFPWLTWLRDSAVQMVFGRPASKDFEQYIPNLGRKYQDEVILRFNISTAEEEAALAEATERLFLDIWSWDGTVDLRVQKNYVKSLLGLLPPSLGSSYWVMVDDLPSAVYASYPSPPTPKEQSQSERRFSVDLMNPPPPNNGDEGLYFFRNYQPHKVVIRWMRLIEAMFPSFVRYTTIGQTYEGRDIPALVVGPGFNDKGQPRRTLVIMGGSHAREWISTTTVNYLAWALITSYGKDPLITKFLNKFDVVFIPELNPDGIEYTWSADRLWRKSRQHTSLQFCRGLDLDHAFGYQWDGSGMHQTDPCSESYGGDEPWESVEVSALRDWAKVQVEANNVDFVGLVDLHSYSQQILFPYAYTCGVEPPNIEKMEELALGLAKSIRLFSGESYSVKAACRGAVTDSNTEKALRIEPTGGSAIDWFYHELGAHYSYQIKLRDTGSYGFLLPSDQIIPTGEEILQSIKYLGDFLLGNDGIENLQTHPEAAAESDEELLAGSEVYDEIMELKKRRRRR
ncbi:putative zinc carboxypeptidase [Diaporthe ampelina]|uniref:Inactive metallocarboxypeptidase ECM14 n=1 Tax=Diaporthe ampelina TaxID=1214573 RepID=A0A0G2FEI8_9PEZI|nr:putative zinc carboxypeptidase [Diaporthe ampelina]